MSSSVTLLDDDDTPLKSGLPSQASSSDLPPNEDEDPAEDNAPDYLQLTALLLSQSKSKGSALPKRGEKDFERHGTRHQDGVLERSRDAMHDALAYTRVHAGKGWVRGFWLGSEGADSDVGLGGDYVVLVEEPKGTHFRSLGRAKGVSGREGKEEEGGGVGSAGSAGKGFSLLWLLPEEALYLVERGNLDLWWPSEGALERILKRRHGGKAAAEEKDGDGEVDEGTPMSLQAAYAMLIGREGERGKVELDRYTVYANLKRTGYVVLRASDWDSSIPAAKTGQHDGVLDVSTPALLANSQSLFTWLWGKFFARAQERIHLPPHGPLVAPGMYRSYHTIYQQLAIIPRHKPSLNPSSSSPAPPPPESPYRVVFHLWKPSRLPTFTKSKPGVPDFRIAVVNANRTAVPTLTQIASLLEGQPFEPPDVGGGLKGNGQLYARIRKGYRSVVVGVVDEGIISYIRFGEGAFGEECVFERFDGGGR